MNIAVAPPPSLRAGFVAALPGAPADLPAGAEDFLQAIANDYRPEEIPGVAAQDLGRLAAGLWTFAQASGGPEPAIRIRRAPDAGGADLEAELVEIVQPDAPFLVDSVMGDLVEAGAGILAMFHPVIATANRPRSAIQVWIEPMGDERWAQLEARLRATLADVRAAVKDFKPMVALMQRTIDELKASPRAEDPDALEEDLAFLSWLDGGQFVFLGARAYTYPRTPDGGYAAEEPDVVPGSSLGLLRDLDRPVLRRAGEPAVLSEAMRHELASAAPLIVAKSNLKTLVHRRAYMDYVGVRRYGRDGRPSGEVRFVGLFTAKAYDEPVRNVPLIRRKIARVMARAGQAAGSHNEMRLANILETYPRDELFQASEDELLQTALGVLHLSDRPRAKLFVRRDPFERFVSVLFYAPRERYDGRLREDVGRVLAEAYGGHVSAYYPTYSDAPLARVNYILGLSPGAHPNPDLTGLERTIAQLARTWSDDFEAVVRRRAPPDKAVPILEVWADGFPIGYRDRYSAAEALADLIAIGQLGPDHPVAIRAYRNAADSSRRFRFKLYHERDPVVLSDVLPILADMGLEALSEEGFALTPGGADGGRDPVWVHEFVLDDPRGETLSFAAVREVFEEAFLAIWRGEAECDGFNRLVLELALPWRSAALVRALARYRQQSGLDPTPLVQQQALSDNTEVTALVLDLFRVRFDPELAETPEGRARLARPLEEEIERALQAVESLDADRALRRIAALVSAIQRTNFYQPGADGKPKPYISFKVASRELADLPDPKPFREIFVASPRVEAAHLRLGPVARGGIRWSDRRDDFRTEVLGLVKAQQVKNAVIVPVGSKGGFFPKRLAKGAPAAADARTEAVAAYRTFLSGMLDLTDNLGPEGSVMPPAHVVVHDPDDPYLVVAADKGTASFSDIANEIAETYGFWLGDAFASGGSAGYDHKAMGITARGAWEGVKRHFREMGKDIQSQPFTCVGVGDMSGDVFGNGMLLSKKSKLVAAFDHRHVFLDPNPDPETSWAERKRLFDLPASSWNDYDRSKLSEGGDVFARTLKSVALSPQAKALLDIKTDQLTPAGLVSAILKARVELLYLGGIGTYVKSSRERDIDVGDKANDQVRVDGNQLRCKVVGEGANLGFTQAARIEYARGGGRINTDAIDNSAGVDTSDHEVNIKILTGVAEHAGRLARPERNALLARMTDEVAAHVLAHNYDQTLALTLLQSEAAETLEGHAEFMADLEARGRLDRELEGLPGPVEISELAQAGLGLTRPELAVLLAYGKIDLAEAITASAAPDDPFFFGVLEHYFPGALAPFAAEMRRHPLRREIIATVAANQMVNLCGPTYPTRLMQAAGCDVAGLTISFEAALAVLGFGEIWGRVLALDGVAPAAAQTMLLRELAQVLRGQTYWLARRAARAPATVEDLVRRYGPAAEALKPLFPTILSAFEQKAAVRRAAAWIKAGAPRELAHQVALYRPLSTAAVLADLAEEKGWPIGPAARVFHCVGGVFGFDRLRAVAGDRPRSDPYERLATRRLIEDLFAEQAALSGAVMESAGHPAAGEEGWLAKSAVAAWSARRAEAVRAAKETISGIEKGGGDWTFAKLTIANAALRALT